MFLKYYVYFCWQHFHILKINLLLNTVIPQFSYCFTSIYVNLIAVVGPSLYSFDFTHLYLPVLNCIKPSAWRVIHYFTSERTEIFLPSFPPSLPFSLSPFLISLSNKWIINHIGWLQDILWATVSQNSQEKKGGGGLYNQASLPASTNPTIGSKSLLHLRVFSPVT